VYARLSHDYDSILVLTPSALLNSTMRNALSASEQTDNGVSVEVLDSQTIALGLGMLIQLAAKAIAEGASLREIDRRLRDSVPCIYMLLCIPELTYLANSGLMDPAQALAAEMMGILPIFAFEEGRLVPTEKVRTPRHMFEAFQDFLGEFEYPSQIAILRTPGRGGMHADPLRQFVKDTFPGALFSEHPVQPHQAAMFGPRSIGLFVMEPGESCKL
jgi:fatty acid kinase fatty acid binding subunit